MATKLVYLDGDQETVIATPPDDEALDALLHALYLIRIRLGDTAFADACADATTAFDAENLVVGTVEMLTAFGAQS